MATRDIRMVDMRYATKMLTLTSTRGMLHLICGRGQNGRTCICLLINRNCKGSYSSNHAVKSFMLFNESLSFNLTSTLDVITLYQEVVWNIVC